MLTFILRFDFSSMYSYLILILGFYVLILSISNILYLKIASEKPLITDGPPVSVLIPARNEADNIGSCIESLSNQTYLNYEIIVLDDQSEDSTREIAEKYCSRLPNLRVISGKPLPNGWNGKPFAMHQLAAEAKGEYLIFTDADTRHKPGSISWAVTNAEKHGFDLLSGYPRHQNKTFGEKLIVPNMYLNTILFLPLWGIPHIPLPIFSMAIGQLMLFRTSSYRECGGYEKVKNQITEDVYISREMKQQGYKTGMLDAGNQLSCRMYNDFNSAVDGIGKNIFDYFDRKLPPVIFLACFIVLFLVLPPVYAVLLSIEGNALFNIVYPGVLLLLTGWGLFLNSRKQDIYLPLIYPVMFFMIILVAAKSVRDFKSGRGYKWKGRILSNAKN